MTQKEFENIIFSAFLNLEIKWFDMLDDGATYYYLTKKELIEEFNYTFNLFKSRGIKGLKPKASKCNECHPQANTFVFYDTANQLPIEKYIIQKENENSYILRMCSNGSGSTGELFQPF